MDGLVLARSTPWWRHQKLSQRRSSWRSGATHAFAFAPIFVAFSFLGEHVMNKAHSHIMKMQKVWYIFFSCLARFNIGVARFWFRYDSASSTEFLSCKSTHVTAHSRLTCIVRQELARFVFCQETWESPVAQDCSRHSAKTHAKSESERERLREETERDRKNEGE